MVLGSALRSGSPSHAYLFHGPPGTGKRAAARALAAELLAEGSPDPDNARLRVAARLPPRPHLGGAERRPRDARGRRRGAGRGGGHAHAVRVAQARLRARARRPDERRGGEPDAEDARGAAALRAPDPADERARARARDGGVALPARALRPAVGRAAHRRAPRRTASSPSARRACARLALGNGERARYLASAEGDALRSEVEALVRHALAGEEARRGRAVAGAARARGGAPRWPPRRPPPRSAPRGSSSSRRAASAVRSSASSRRRRSAKGGVPAPRCSTWRSTWPRCRSVTSSASPRAPTTPCSPATACAALAAEARSRDPRRLRTAAERCEETRESLEVNVSEDLALQALTFRLRRLVGSGS